MHHRAPLSLISAFAAVASTTYGVVGSALIVSSLGFVLAPATANAQRPDPMKPPPMVSAAGPFTVRRFDVPPKADDRNWNPVSVQSGFPSPRAAEVPNRRFSLRFADAGPDNDAEFERYRLIFQRGRGPAFRIDQGFTSWVYVTPDTRFIVTEPLYVLDVDAWTQYALHEALDIPNYTSIEAISRDGKRLLVTRTDCAFDCSTDEGTEFYELTLRR
jgi:hypothetical protein